MQISVETVGTLGRRLVVAVPAEVLERAFSDRLMRLSREVKVPGFRPGKAPLKMIEARYGGKLMEEAADDVINSTLSDAISAQKLQPATGTRVQRKPLVRGQNLEYTAEFEIYPEITRLDLTGVEIERPTPSVNDDDVERTVQSIRRQRATWNPVERPAQTGDQLHVDFVGRLEGAEVEGAKAQNRPVVIGAGNLLQEIEQGLIGMTPGELRTVPAKFPTTYSNAKLAGKTVDFEVKVQAIAEPVLPELDDDLAIQMGVADGRIATLRTEVRANLERESAARARAVLRQRVFNALLDRNRVDVPAALVEAEVERMKKLMRDGGAGAAVDGSVYRERAQRRVALGLVLVEIIKARGLKIDAAKLRERVQQMAVDYEAPEQFIQWYYANPERLREVESRMLEDQAVDMMLATAQVRDRTVGFQELLGLEAQA